MTAPFLFAVLVLASARLTRLVVTDTITASFRTWVLRRSSWFGELVSCPWCFGVWASTAVVAAAWLTGVSLPFPLLWPWAVAGGQMLVNGIDLRLDTH